MEQAQPMHSFMEAIAESQREAWARLFGSTDDKGQAPVFKRLEEAYRFNLGVGQRVVSDTLRAQGEQVKLLRRIAHDDQRLPQPVIDMTDAGLSLFEQMLGIRSRMWNQWFESANSVDLDRLRSNLPGSGSAGDALGGWTELSRQWMDAQARWFRTFAPEAQEAQAAADVAEMAESEREESTGSASKRIPRAGTGRRSA